MKSDTIGILVVDNSQTVIEKFIDKEQTHSFNIPIHRSLSKKYPKDILWHNNCLV